MGSTEQYAVFSPGGRPVRKSALKRKSITDFNRMVIAELWDDRFYGDEIFDTLREEFRQRYPGAKVIEHWNFGNTHGADEEKNLSLLAEKLAEFGCNAAISAVGA